MHAGVDTDEILWGFLLRAARAGIGVVRCLLVTVAVVRSSKVGRSPRSLVAMAGAANDARADDARDGTLSE